jgi:hypothetical protein
MPLKRTGRSCTCQVSLGSLFRPTRSVRKQGFLATRAGCQHSNTMTEAETALRVAAVPVETRACVLQHFIP